MLEKWCQSKYTHSGAAPIKSNVRHSKCYSELSFGEGKPVSPFLRPDPEQCTIPYKTPKARSKSQPAEEMAGEREEVTPLHGAINEEEAKL